MKLTEENEGIKKLNSNWDPIYLDTKNAYIYLVLIK